MSFQPPKRQGFQRVSETDSLRNLHDDNSHFLETSDQQGKFCKACNKYFGYLKASDILCKNCNARLEVLNK